jgi:hypothetical protein
MPRFPFTVSVVGLFSGTRRVSVWSSLEVVRVEDDLRSIVRPADDLVLGSDDR